LTKRQKFAKVVSGKQKSKKLTLCMEIAMTNFDRPRENPDEPVIREDTLTPRQEWALDSNLRMTIDMVYQLRFNERPEMYEIDDPNGLGNLINVAFNFRPIVDEAGSPQPVPELPHEPGLISFVERAAEGRGIPLDEHIGQNLVHRSPEQLLQEMLDKFNSLNPPTGEMS